MRVAARVRPSENSSTRPSIAISFKPSRSVEGSCAKSSGSIQKDNSTPKAPPASDTSRLSVSSCLASLVRPAPSAMRIPSSCLRASPLASSMFEMSTRIIVTPCWPGCTSRQGFDQGIFSWLISPPWQLDLYGRPHGGRPERSTRHALRLPAGPPLLRPRLGPFRGRGNRRQPYRRLPRVLRPFLLPPSPSSPSFPLPSRIEMLISRIRPICSC